MTTTGNIPIHDLESSEPQVRLREIAHKNSYDFTQKHRHSYFEVLFFIEGEGTNLIDFIDYPINDHSCYIVYPQQIHLLKRSPQSHGFVIQFTEESIFSDRLLRLLQERQWSDTGAVLFKQDKKQSDKLLSYIKILQEKQEGGGLFSYHIEAHLLHALLFELLSAKGQGSAVPKEPAFFQFQQLIERHYHEMQQVSDYLKHLPIGEKKLSTLSKQYFGITPLQMIHRRLLLEAKRRLLFGDQSHKEIAYELGFDNPPAFSAFIKKKTGFTASEIQQQVTEIHNR